MITAEQTSYFSSLSDQHAVGAEDFPEEKFVPCKGTILVVFPPSKERTKGGMIIPERLVERPNVARVAAIPQDPKCPVKVGDWIVTRYRGGYMVPFNDRKDLSLLQYAEDSSSELLGFFRAADINLELPKQES